MKRLDLAFFQKGLEPSSPVQRGCLATPVEEMTLGEMDSKAASRRSSRKNHLSTYDAGLRTRRRLEEHVLQLGLGRLRGSAS